MISGMISVSRFIKSSVTPIAPIMDLEATWEMIKYKQFKQHISERCIKSMTNHLWYLYPSLIPFSLLASEMSRSEKKDIPVCKKSI